MATALPLFGSSLSRFKPLSMAAVSAVIPNLRKKAKSSISLLAQRRQHFISLLTATASLHFRFDNDTLPSIAIYQPGSPISPANMYKMMERCQCWSKICMIREGVPPPQLLLFWKSSKGHLTPLSILSEHTPAFNRSASPTQTSS